MVRGTALPAHLHARGWDQRCAWLPPSRRRAGAPVGPVQPQPTFDRRAARHAHIVRGRSSAAQLVCADAAIDRGDRIDGVGLRAAHAAVVPERARANRRRRCARDPDRQQRRADGHRDRARTTPRQTKAPQGCPVATASRSRCARRPHAQAAPQEGRQVQEREDGNDGCDVHAAPPGQAAARAHQQALLRVLRAVRPRRRSGTTRSDQARLAAGDAAHGAGAHRRRPASRGLDQAPVPGSDSHNRRDARRREALGRGQLDPSGGLARVRRVGPGPEGAAVRRQGRRDRDRTRGATRCGLAHGPGQQVPPREALRDPPLSRISHCGDGLPRATSRGPGARYRPRRA